MFLIPQSSNSCSPLLKRDGGEPISGFDAPQLFSLPPGWAKAGIAMATIMAAITKAAVTTNIVRLISTILSVAGRRKDEDPRPCLLAPKCLGGRGTGVSPKARIFGVAWALLAGSELPRPLRAKFAEHPSTHSGE